MIKRVLLVCLLVVSLAAPIALALEQPAGTGTVTVKVTDENGVDMNGKWYLHQGTGNQGLMLRNGTKGETFFMPAGYYFLDTWRLPKYEGRRILGANPQLVDVGSAIEYVLQYFKTQADMDAVITAEQAVAETAEIPAMAEISSEEETAVPDEPSRQTIETHYVFARPFEMAPITLTTPSNSGEGGEAAPETPVVYALAATGPSATLLLFVLMSIAGGIAYTMKKDIG
ncbi:hypothetical protein JXA05_03725 [Candidatus Peregrinibacteria bacterium]|nr:hypothetical protein [Candidatus Peregrinibacteria bacterium]